MNPIKGIKILRLTNIMKFYANLYKSLYFMLILRFYAQLLNFMLFFFFMPSGRSAIYAAIALVGIHILKPFHHLVLDKKTKY